MVDVSCGSVIRVISVILDRLRQDQEARLRSSALGAGPACRDAAIADPQDQLAERSTAPLCSFSSSREDQRLICGSPVRQYTDTVLYCSTTFGLEEARAARRAPTPDLRFGHHVSIILASRV